ncbi:MAG TPA: phosphopantetheine-binding protein [Actinocrinis sp.]|jgi:acyl carrier protein|uniref:phosphopantetheine-binding protein n=1 Tax=Actinocrinis sp. TaxID=1920516 RepID=UPI002DDD5C2A|nr:phosphopantetheine-binding protein [Actinocrinis sp.]HEV3172572.1 phosphopantetheine-binding protein [Actinocrinis sp.]
MSDRQALVAESPGGADGTRAPATETERALAQIWGAVLGLDDAIELSDNFFDLGGHSLLAVETAARSTAVFGVRITVKAVFEAPTVAGLAARIDALRLEGRCGS